MNISLLTPHLYYRRGIHRRLFVEGLLIGAATGIVASSFRYAIGFLDGCRRSFAPLITGSPLYAVIFALVLILVGLLLYYIVKLEPLTSGSGIPQLKGVLNDEIKMDWRRVLLLKFVGAAVALGAGLSLGREGPSVQLGGAVGQGVAQIEKRTKEEEHYLMMAGSGAGLAAAFNAPLSGVIFCFEELSHKVSPLVLMGTLGATVVATVFSRLFFGARPVFTLPHLFEFSPTASWALAFDYLLFALLGLFVGWAAKFFTPGLLHSLDWYLVHLKPQMRPMLPLALAFAALFFLPEILGGGAHLVGKLATAHYALPFLVILFIAKFSFTVICFGSGVPGGIFLPMLVLGASLGAIFGTAAEMFGLLPDPVYFPAFVVFGMAGYFAAVVKAPVTGSILIAEMTGSFPLLLPLIFVALIAYFTADALGAVPVYDALLNRTRRMKRALDTINQQRNK